MCTLLLLRGVVAGFPLVLAMNRDEFLDRPSAGPRVWAGPPPFVAPVDVRAGGTWCGVAANGLLVAVTNRGRERAAGKRSRGALVLELLAAGGREKAQRRLEGGEFALQFNGFHALLADDRGAFLVQSDASGLEVRSLDAPLSVLTNGGPSPDIHQILEELDGKALSTWTEAETSITAMLRRHDLPTCQHHEDRGTRSSILFALPPGRLDGGKLLFADGPPCTHPYQDLSSMLTELGGSPWNA